MKIVCLDANTLGVDADLSDLKKLGEFVSYGVTKPQDTVERLKDADIVITNKVLITDEIMSNTNLKLICVSATGTNNIDLKAAKKHGICVKNAVNYSTYSVVQQTFASLFELTNSVSYYKEYVSSKKWIESDIFTHLKKPIIEIANKQFGIIGLGNIGSKVADIASVFGAKVRYYSTSGQNSNPNFIQVNLDSLIKTSDIISIHSPLNENTKNLIGEKEFAKMKNGAIIMNFGRGGIIDEQALAKAIDEKDIKAVLDVLETEPMTENNPLLRVNKRQNLVITPHIAWASVEARKRLIKIIVKNIKDFQNGK